MQNIILYDNSLLEGAVISCAQEQAIAPASNLLKMQPKEVFATVDANSTAVIEIQLPKQTSFDSFSLLHTNLTGPPKNNWLHSSQDFEQSSSWSGFWPVGSATRVVTANDTAAPDGTITADKVIASGVGTSSGIGQNMTLFDLTPGESYTVSFYIKRVLGGTETTTINLTYATGTAFASIEAQKQITTDAAGEWTREQFTFTAVDSMGHFFGVEGLLVGESGIYLWGAQLEVGEIATQYSPTAIRFATVNMVTAPTQAELTTNPTFSPLAFTAYASPTDESLRHSFYNYAITSNGVGLLEALWVRISILDLYNTDGFISIGNLFLGTAFSPELNLQYGSSMGFIDDSIIDMTENAIVPTPLTNRKTAEIILHLSSEEERSRVNSFLSRVGSSKDILVITDPSNVFYRHETMHHGLLQKTRTISEPIYRLYETRFSLIDLT